MNLTRRLCVLVPVALLALAVTVAPAQAAKRISIKDAPYTIKLSGTQITTWSYDHVQTRLDCQTHYTGKGSQRYDFTSPRIRAVVRSFNGTPSIDQASGKLNVVQDIQGAAKYVNSGPAPCANSTFEVEDDGCGRRSMKGSFSLLFEGRSKLKNSLSDDLKFDQCPSGASGGTDSAGGHSLENIAGKVNANSLLRSKSKRVSATQTFKKDIKHGNVKIGEEQTTLQWTLSFKRLRK